MDPSKYIPSFKEVVTPEYIDQIILSGKWVEHGSTLEEFIEERVDEEALVDVAHLGWKDVLISSEFKEYLTNWLPHRYTYSKELIVQELTPIKNNYKPSSTKPAFPLTVDRTMLMTQELREQLINGDNIDIGRFWGTQSTDAWGVEMDDSLLHTTITATILPGDIDWIETMKSRIDYVNGDQEAEIQLRKSAQPVFQSIYCSDKCEDIPIKPREIESAIQKHIASWLEQDVKNINEINQGYCADFADSFVKNHKKQELSSNLEIRGCYDSNDIHEQGLKNESLPAWASWQKIELLTKNNVFNHTFIKCDNKYYDAECIYGVECAFDLPIFERAGYEYIASLHDFKSDHACEVN